MNLMSTSKWLSGLLMALVLGLPVAAGSGPLQDLQGNTRSLSEFTGGGKWTVVMIWASDCLICNAEMHQYVDFHTFHQEKDARVLGISMDGQEKKDEAKAFIERHAVNFPTLIGEPEEVAALYIELSGRPWRGTPTFLIYGPNGELRAQQVGAVPPKLIEDYMARNSADQ